MGKDDWSGCLVSRGVCDSRPGRRGLQACGGVRQLSSLAQCSFHIWSRNHGNPDVPILKTDQTLQERVEEGDKVFCTRPTRGNSILTAFLLQENK